MPDSSFIVDIILLFLLIITAVAAIRIKDLLISTILLGVFSLLMASQYLVLGAPDVAITEAAVGGGISTILLLLSLFLVGDKEAKTKGSFFVPISVILIVGTVLVYTMFFMPEFGGEFTPAQVHVAPYYITNAEAETSVPNVVTAVLASYRGYDTFGETTVVMTAALAVLLLIGRSRKGGRP